MKVRRIDQLTRDELAVAINQGGRLVFFEMCISLIAITLRRPTPIFLVPFGSQSWLAGLPYSLVTLLLGWWGIPWGPLYTPIVLVTNLGGGCDVTAQICETLGLVNPELSNR